MPVDVDGHTPVHAGSNSVGSRSASVSEEWVRIERDALGESPDGHGEENVEDGVKVETPDAEQLERDVGGSGSGSRDDSPSST